MCPTEHSWAYGNEAVREQILENVNVYRIEGPCQPYRSFSLRVGARVFLADEPGKLRARAVFLPVHEDRARNLPGGSCCHMRMQTIAIPFSGFAGLSFLPPMDFGALSTCRPGGCGMALLLSSFL